MNVRRLEPALDPTQTFERASQQNPQARGQQRAVARRAEIGDGSARDSERDDDGGRDGAGAR
jgi:hypothetical protein